MPTMKTPNPSLRKTPPRRRRRSQPKTNARKSTAADPKNVKKSRDVGKLAGREPNVIPQKSKTAIDGAQSPGRSSGFAATALPSNAVDASVISRPPLQGSTGTRSALRRLGLSGRSHAFQLLEVPCQTIGANVFLDGLHPRLFGAVHPPNVPQP